MSDINMLKNCRELCREQLKLMRKRERLDMMVGLKAASSNMMFVRGGDISDPVFASASVLADTDAELRQIEIRIRYIQQILLDKISMLEDPQEQTVLLYYYVAPLDLIDYRLATYTDISLRMGYKKSKIGNLKKSGLKHFADIPDEDEDEEIRAMVEDMMREVANDGE